MTPEMIDAWVEAAFDSLDPNDPPMSLTLRIRYGEVAYIRWVPMIQNG